MTPPAWDFGWVTIPESLRSKVRWGGVWGRGSFWRCPFDGSWGYDGVVPSRPPSYPTDSGGPVTEAIYIAGIVAVLVLASWLWQRYGKGAAGGWFATLATLMVAIEILKLWARPHPETPEPEPTALPLPTSEAKRKELAEALKSGQQRLDEAREDGTAALKDELRRNRLDREGT